MTEYTPLPFGATLGNLLARYNMSAATVSRMLGHKSRTTLRRILTDQSNAESMEKFLHDFLSIPVLPLTAAEQSELRLALDYSRMGPAGFRARTEMMRLMRAPSCPSGEEISIRCIQSGCVLTLEEFFRELAGSDRVRMLLINSGLRCLCGGLTRFIESNPRIDLLIEHYLYLSHDISRTAQFIAAIFPLLSIPCYTAYAIPSSCDDHPAFHTLSSSVIACRAERSDGSVTEYQLGFTDPLSAQLLRYPEPGIFEYWQNLTALGRASRLPVKISSPSSGRSLKEYVALHSIYRDLEHNHDIYMLKPGLHPAMVPPDLLRIPFLEAIRQSSMGADPDFDRLFAQLCDIHIQRFHNIFHKKRVSHIFIPPESVRAFLSTGQIPDLTTAVRPFTPKERREILIHCRDQARDNPYFNIYFLKGELADLRLEATCYEPVGVMFHGSTALDDFSSGHTDALVALNEFTGLFSQFIRETLFPHYALTASASVAVLTSMIDALPEKE